jgi:hypothetical protein
MNLEEKRARNILKLKIAKDLETIIKEEDCRVGESCGSERLREYVEKMKNKIMEELLYSKGREKKVRIKNL